MSLKVFHVFFILVSDALAVGFAFWAMRPSAGPRDASVAVLGMASLALSAALSVYLVWFFKKVKKGFNA